MSIRNIVIILIILILIPIIMERVEFSFSALFSNPKDTIIKCCLDVFNFYKNSIGNWVGNWIQNIIDEKIKGKKIEIEIK